MDILIYFGITLIAVAIADLRAKKGEKSFLLLTIVAGCYTIFHTIAILNANGKGENNVVLTGIILIVANLIVYFISIYITGKQAEKCKKNSENSSVKVIYPYKLTQSIFSPKEGYFYRDVRPIADKLGLIVFTKMRLADLLEVPKSHPEFTKWFNKIKAKHIDFIFVDMDYHIRLLVEVDDPSHNRPDRQARDEEVDEMFRQQGLEVLHLRAWGKQYGADDLETIITNALSVQKMS